MPRIARFSDYIDKMDLKLLEMQLIIQKFDETLSLKANKNVLTHTLKEFEKGYVRKVDNKN